MDGENLCVIGYQERLRTAPTKENLRQENIRSCNSIRSAAKINLIQKERTNELRHNSVSVVEPQPITTHETTIKSRCIHLRTNSWISSLEKYDKERNSALLGKVRRWNAPDIPDYTDFSLRHHPSSILLPDSDSLTSAQSRRQDQKDLTSLIKQIDMRIQTSERNLVAKRQAKTIESYHDQREKWRRFVAERTAQDALAVRFARSVISCAAAEAQHLREELLDDRQLSSKPRHG